MAPAALQSSSSTSQIPTPSDILAAKEASQLPLSTLTIQSTELQLERQQRKEYLAAALRIFGKRGFDHYTVRFSVRVFTSCASWLKVPFSFP